MAPVVLQLQSNFNTSIPGWQTLLTTSYCCDVHP